MGQLGARSPCTLSTKGEIEQDRWMGKGGGKQGEQIHRVRAPLVLDSIYRSKPLGGVVAGVIIPILLLQKLRVREFN